MQSRELYFPGMSLRPSISTLPAAPSRSFTTFQPLPLPLPLPLSLPSPPCRRGGTRFNLSYFSPEILP